MHCVVVLNGFVAQTADDTSRYEPSQAKPTQPDPIRSDPIRSGLIESTLSNRKNIMLDRMRKTRKSKRAKRVRFATLSPTLSTSTVRKSYQPTPTDYFCACDPA
ncbi:hypothetical protein V9T40_014818 [Parthenolecanium corni]|uniref:Uncharacterized protein n=1 Tax=Parthenolecanium corni TaxID=536013 RepID=A0AAN9T4K6_9HEMI